MVDEIRRMAKCPSFFLSTTNTSPIEQYTFLQDLVFVVILIEITTMKFKYVLYTARVTETIRTKLRIVKYHKIKSKKNNVYFVGFASEEDAQYAQKACKHIQNVTIKPFQSKSSPIITTLPETTTTNITSSMTSSPSTVQTGKFAAKIKLVSRHLPPNSLESRQLLESIDACLNAMNIVKQTFDKIIQLHQEHETKTEIVYDELYTEHSTALYMKMALTSQLKAMSSTNLRLVWSTIASQVNLFERHVYHEQSFIKHIRAKQNDLFKRIHFQSSVAMSSKLAYQLIKLVDT